MGRKRAWRIKQASAFKKLTTVSTEATVSAQLATVSTQAAISTEATVSTQLKTVSTQTDSLYPPPCSLPGVTGKSVQDNNDADITVISGPTVTHALLPMDNASLGASGKMDSISKSVEKAGLPAEQIQHREKLRHRSEASEIIYSWKHTTAISRNCSLKNRHKTSIAASENSTVLPEPKPTMAASRDSILPIGKRTKNISSKGQTFSNEEISTRVASENHSLTSKQKRAMVASKNRTNTSEDRALRSRKKATKVASEDSLPTNDVKTREVALKEKHAERNVRKWSGLREFQQLIGCPVLPSELTVTSDEVTPQRMSHPRRVKRPVVIQGKPAHLAQDSLSRTDHKVATSDETSHLDMAIETGSNGPHSTDPLHISPNSELQPQSRKIEPTEVKRNVTNDARKGLRAKPLKRQLLQVKWDIKKRKLDKTSNGNVAEKNLSSKTQKWTGLREFQQLIGCAILPSALADEEVIDDSVHKQRVCLPRKVKKQGEKQGKQEQLIEACHEADPRNKTTSDEDTQQDLQDSDMIIIDQQNTSSNSQVDAEVSCAVKACSNDPLRTDPSSESDQHSTGTENTEVTRNVTAARKRLRASPLKRQPLQITWNTKRRKIDQDHNGLSCEKNDVSTGESISYGSETQTVETAADSAVSGSCIDVNIPQDLGDTERTSAASELKSVTPGELTNIGESDPEGLRCGELVWARLGQKVWWPAIIITGALCDLPPTGTNSSWVMWFGDHKISKIQHQKVMPFATKVNDYISIYKKSKLSKEAIREVLLECAARTRNSDILEEDKDSGKNDLEKLIAWARGGFVSNGYPANPQHLMPSSELVFPPAFRQSLDKLRGTNLTTTSYSVEEEGTLCSPDTLDIRRKSFYYFNDRLNLVKAGQIKIEEICISCGRDDVSLPHPYFKGGLCKSCHEIMMDGMFVYDEDGSNVYCVICGNGGELFICDSTECSLVYCTSCIKQLVSPAEPDLIQANPSWICYLCHDPADQRSFGLLERKKDWRVNVLKMFQRYPGPELSLPSDLPKRPIRVLSLFDGIATAKVVLDALGIDLEVYYASEIEEDAIMVTQVRHGTLVQQIGDIRMLTVDKLVKMCPIDLVIGGSPCNELSIANPRRQGLSGGTGALFFEYPRVLSLIQAHTTDRHVFWLFENVCFLNKDIKDTISRFLQCEPAMWDAKHFSAQQRRRNFWGNIPGMYCPQQVTTHRRLDDSLMGTRTAQVSSVRTVTTMSNSLMQGKDQDIFPVQMGERCDTLWIPELERLFGFPQHYTDVGNLPATRRQKLIGKSWSVPVIKHILTPLKQFFKLTSEKQQSN